ncbi:MAG: DUF4286 family protein [Myxococcaceae bacterium]|nr:DUF4286 family protein [Myxococcaceae bacterium]
MVLYEVTVDVVPDRADDFERYMRQAHIPAILATGCFRRIRLARASANRFRTWYEAERQEDLDVYLREHTTAMRADFQAHFPQGATAFREVWTELQSWP